MKYPKETTLDEREEAELAVEVGRENMPGGKAVLVDLMKWEREPRRAAKEIGGIFFFFFCFYLIYLVISRLLRYKNSRGALAMA